LVFPLFFHLGPHVNLAPQRNHGVLFSATDLPVVFLVFLASSSDVLPERAPCFAWPSDPTLAGRFQRRLPLCLSFLEFQFASFPCSSVPTRLWAFFLLPRFEPAAVPLIFFPLPSFCFFFDFRVSLPSFFFFFVYSSPGSVLKVHQVLGMPPPSQ